MIKKTGIRFAMAILFVAAAATAMFAATACAAENPYEQQILQARYDQVSATVNFNTAVMGDVVELVPQAAGLNEHIDRLNSDLSTLYTYVEASDKGGFNGYLQDTVRPDLNAANDALKDARKNFKDWNVTRDTIQELRDRYVEHKAEFEAQVNSAKLQLGNIKLGYYNDVMAKTDERMSKLNEKGVDTNGMMCVKSGAISNVITPLQNAVSSGDGNAVKNELRTRCMFNGAQYSFHYAAKIDLEALKAITSAIADNATQAGYGDEIAEVNAKLSAAENTLNEVGTSPYTDAQKEQIWNNLKDASGLIRSIIQGMNGNCRQE
ncbi:hypothetical protein CUJ83_10320 [Methanocella sp. CWC-04]|uniref:Uncharacterized protein n=1 Tax=Methanooceanicella nereidis TaxID=2052831 RepID=A0AAP2W6K8_9EURY|nr:hypothetical protein [Methanocella sp. CWC-04]MCD1295392.1 hypothetical protein [Methanocella sp. CWC-04]